LRKAPAAPRHRPWPAKRSRPPPLLDALRGIAAVAVMLHHEPLLYAARGAITRAYLAVDFFYMLSGLVLTLAFEPRFAQTGARHFMLTRARLWPVMAVGVLLGACGNIWATARRGWG
jgi:peptidoglycan/LPS O-acetylase OafA/YrhL